MFLHIRLDTDAPVAAVETYVKKLSNKYIIAHETTGKQHYHIHMQYELPKSTPHYCRKLSQQFAQEFDIRDPKGKSCSIDKGRSANYTLKDGNYVYSGYTDEEIEKLRKESYTKGKDTYRKEEIQIESRFLSRELTSDEYVKQIVRLKIKFDKNIYITHMKARLLTLTLKRDSDDYLNNFSKYIHNEVQFSLRGADYM